MTPLQTTSPIAHEPPPSCTILPADFGDLESICRFDPIALRDRRQREFVACAIEEGRCWMAFFDETPVGYGIFNYQFQGYGVIHRVFVSPGYRRRGIGRALVDYFGDACSSPRLYIGVLQHDLAMLELVRTRGYILSGVVHELCNSGSALIYVKNLMTSTPLLVSRGLQ
jgi:GNAT superfamily N-acetyltransferase